MDFQHIKTLLVTVGSAILAFLAPLADDLYVMLILFGCNALFGIIADAVENKPWDKKKFLTAGREALLFFLFVLIIYAIGTLKQNSSEALMCVSFISYALIYYYGTNICRNMMNILPDESLGHKVFAFLYFVLSAECIKRIPYLNKYIKTK